MIVKFQTWVKVFGDRYPASGLEEVKRWSEKGVDAEWAADWFLDSRAVKCEEVKRCAVQRIATPFADWRKSNYYNPNMWVLELKDGSFSLVETVNEFERNEGIENDDWLFEVARGSSLIECLDRSDLGRESELYKDLFRAAKSNNLQL